MVRAERLVRDADGARAKLIDDLDDSARSQLLESDDIDTDELVEATRKYDRLDAEYRAQYQQFLEDGDLRQSWVDTVGSESIDPSDVETALDTVEDVELRGHSIIEFDTADDVNAQYPDNIEDPYEEGTVVAEFETDDEDVFARVHGEDNQARSWMVSGEKDLTGLTPEEIEDRLALPEEPTYVSEVHVPRGTKVRSGEIAPNFGEPGGARQFELLERLDPSNFRNRRELPI